MGVAGPGGLNELDLHEIGAERRKAGGESAPASTGSIVVISATGEGQTDPPGVDGKPGDSPAPVPLQPVTATIGGLDAQVMSAGGVPGLATGYLQVAVQIPDGTTPGDAVSIVLRIGEGTSQANVTLAVH